MTYEEDVNSFVDSFLKKKADDKARIVYISNDFTKYPLTMRKDSPVVPKEDVNSLVDRFLSAKRSKKVPASKNKSATSVSVPKVQSNKQSASNMPQDKQADLIMSSGLTDTIDDYVSYRTEQLSNPVYANLTNDKLDKIFFKDWYRQELKNNPKYATQLVDRVFESKSSSKQAAVKTSPSAVKNEGGFLDYLKSGFSGNIAQQHETSSKWHQIEADALKRGDSRASMGENIDVITSNVPEYQQVGSKSVPFNLTVDPVASVILDKILANDMAEKLAESDPEAFKQAVIQGREIAAARNQADSDLWKQSVSVVPSDEESDSFSDYLKWLAYHTAGQTAYSISNMLKSSAIEFGLGGLGSLVGGALAGPAGAAKGYKIGHTGGNILGNIVSGFDEADDIRYDVYKESLSNSLAKGVPLEQAQADAYAAARESKLGVGAFTAATNSLGDFMWDSVAGSLIPNPLGRRYVGKVAKGALGMLLDAANEGFQEAGQDVLTKFYGGSDDVFTKDASDSANMAFQTSLASALLHGLIRKGGSRLAQGRGISLSDLKNGAVRLNEVGSDVRGLFNEAVDSFKSAKDPSYGVHYEGNQDIENRLESGRVDMQNKLVAQGYTQDMANTLSRAAKRNGIYLYESSGGKITPEQAMDLAFNRVDEVQKTGGSGYQFDEDGYIKTDWLGRPKLTEGQRTGHYNPATGEVNIYGSADSQKVAHEVLGHHVLTQIENAALDGQKWAVDTLKQVADDIGVDFKKYIHDVASNRTAEGTARNKLQEYFAQSAEKYLMDYSHGYHGNNGSMTSQTRAILDRLGDAGFDFYNNSYYNLDSANGLGMGRGVQSVLDQIYGRQTGNANQASAVRNDTIPVNSVAPEVTPEVSPIESDESRDAEYSDLLSNGFNYDANIDEHVVEQIIKDHEAEQAAKQALARSARFKKAKQRQKESIEWKEFKHAQNQAAQDKSKFTSNVDALKGLQSQSPEQSQATQTESVSPQQEESVKPHNEVQTEKVSPQHEESVKSGNESQVDKVGSLLEAFSNPDKESRTSESKSQQEDSGEWDEFKRVQDKNAQDKKARNKKERDKFRSMNDIDVAERLRRQYEQISDEHRHAIREEVRRHIEETKTPRDRELEQIKQYLMENTPLYNFFDKNFKDGDEIVLDEHSTLKRDNGGFYVMADNKSMVWKLLRQDQQESDSDGQVLEYRLSDIPYKTDTELMSIISPEGLPEDLIDAVGERAEMLDREYELWSEGESKRQQNMSSSSSPVCSYLFNKFAHQDEGSIRIDPHTNVIVDSVRGIFYVEADPKSQWHELLKDLHGVVDDETDTVTYTLGGRSPDTEALLWKLTENGKRIPRCPKYLKKRIERVQNLINAEELESVLKKTPSVGESDTPVKSESKVSETESAPVKSENAGETESANVENNVSETKSEPAKQEAEPVSAKTNESKSEPVKQEVESTPVKTENISEAEPIKRDVEPTPVKTENAAEAELAKQNVEPAPVKSDEVESTPVNSEVESKPESESDKDVYQLETEAEPGMKRTLWDDVRNLLLGRAKPYSLTESGYDGTALELVKLDRNKQQLATKYWDRSNSTYRLLVTGHRGLDEFERMGYVSRETVKHGSKRNEQYMVKEGKENEFLEWLKGREVESNEKNSKKDWGHKAGDTNGLGNMSENELLKALDSLNEREDKLNSEIGYINGREDKRGLWKLQEELKDVKEQKAAIENEIGSREYDGEVNEEDDLKSALEFHRNREQRYRDEGNDAMADLAHEQVVKLEQELNELQSSPSQTAQVESKTSETGNYTSESNKNDSSGVLVAPERNAVTDLTENSPSQTAQNELKASEEGNHTSEVEKGANRPVDAGLERNADVAPVKSERVAELEGRVSEVRNNLEHAQDMLDYFAHHGGSPKVIKQYEDKYDAAQLELTKLENELVNARIDDDKKTYADELNEIADELAAPVKGDQVGGQDDDSKINGTEVVGGEHASPEIKGTEVVPTSTSTSQIQNQSPQGTTNPIGTTNTATQSVSQSETNNDSIFYNSESPKTKAEISDNIESAKLTCDMCETILQRRDVSPQISNEARKQLELAKRFLDSVNRNKSGSTDGFNLIIGEQGIFSLDKLDGKQLRRKALDFAKHLESLGHSSDDIHSATGWERGKDGKWRYEISDFKLKKDFNLTESLGSYNYNFFDYKINLDDLIYNDKFFSAYPQLRGDGVVVRFTVMPPLAKDSSNVSRGDFVFERIKRADSNALFSIRVRRNEFLNSCDILTRDMQHNGFLDVCRDTRTLTLKNPTGLRSILTHEMQHIVQLIEGFSVGSSSASSLSDYHRSAGEVEARNASKRLSLTAEERLDKSISSTEDVPRHEQTAISESEGKELARKKLREQDDKMRRMYGFSGFHHTIGEQGAEGKLAKRSELKHDKWSQARKGGFNQIVGGTDLRDKIYPQGVGESYFKYNGDFYWQYHRDLVKNLLGYDDKGNLNHDRFLATTLDGNADVYLHRGKIDGSDFFRHIVMGSTRLWGEKLAVRSAVLSNLQEIIQNSRHVDITPNDDVTKKGYNNFYNLFAVVNVPAREEQNIQGGAWVVRLVCAKPDTDIDSNGKAKVHLYDIYPERKISESNPSTVNSAVPDESGGMRPKVCPSDQGSFSDNGITLYQALDGVKIRGHDIRNEYLAEHTIDGQKDVLSLRDGFEQTTGEQSVSLERLQQLHDQGGYQAILSAPEYQQSLNSNPFVSSFSTTNENDSKGFNQTIGQQGVQRDPDGYYRLGNVYESNYKNQYYTHDDIQQLKQGKNPKNPDADSGPKIGIGTRFVQALKDFTTPYAGVYQREHGLFGKYIEHNLVANEHLKQFERVSKAIPGLTSVYIESIIGDMSTPQKDLFGKLMFYLDAARENGILPAKLDLVLKKAYGEGATDMKHVDKSHLPLGYGNGLLGERDFLRDLDSLINAANSEMFFHKGLGKKISVMQAVYNRTGSLGIINREYVKCAESLRKYGLDNVIGNPAWLHHQILEFVKLDSLSRNETLKVKTGSGRGMLQSRTGENNLSYNTDFIEVEADTFSAKQRDIAMMKALKAIFDNMDRSNEFKIKAMQAENGDFHFIIGDSKDFLSGKMNKAEQQDFLHKLANAAWGGDLPSNAYTGDKVRGAGHYFGRVIHELSEQAYSDAEKQGPRGTKEFNPDAKLDDIKVTPALREYIEFLSELETTPATSGDFISFRDFIPKGWAEYDPNASRMLFTDKSVLEQVVEEGAKIGLKTRGFVMEDDMLRPMLGNANMAVVIPTNIAQTLGDIGRIRDDGAIAKLLKKITNTWREVVLFSPTRVIKSQFIKNTFGDVDATVAGNPTAFKYMKRAASDMYKHVFRGEVTKGDFMEAFRRGVFSVGELRSLTEQDQQMYKEIFGGAVSNGKVDSNVVIRNIKKASREAIDWYTDKIFKISDFREGITRLANFYSFVDEMRDNSKNGNGFMPKDYAMSNPEQVKVLGNNIYDIAAKMANDVVGDYVGVSATGKKLRQVIFPFWSWQEFNPTRYFNLFRNAFMSGGVGSMAQTAAPVLFKGGLKVGWKAFKVYLASAALSTLMGVWNRTVMKDEDDELPEDVRNKMHLTLGKWFDGRIHAWTDLSAFGSLLDVFGLSRAVQIPSMVADLMNGEWDYDPHELYKSPLNNFIQLLNPLITKPIEFSTGYKLYPNALEPEKFRDNKGKYLAQSLGVGQTLNTLMGEPGAKLTNLRGYTEMISASYREGEPAWWDILNKRNKFAEEVLNRSRNTTDPDYDDDKTLVLRHLRHALMNGEEDMVVELVNKYLITRGNSGINGLNASLRALDPLYGLDPKQRARFIKYIGPKGKRELDKAYKFYRELRSVYPRLMKQASKLRKKK